MKGYKRKNILNTAKAKIEARLLDDLAKADKLLQDELDAGVPNSARYEALAASRDEAVFQLKDFKKSKKAKKKASIEWQIDALGQTIANQMKKSVTKTITDPDALRKIRDTHKKSIRPRASEWLQEGGLVVARGKKMPMMVLSISGTGTVQVLNAGHVDAFRDIALRPYVNDEE